MPAKIPKEDLISELKRHPTSTEMRNKGEYSPNTYSERFGSFTNAKVEASIAVESYECPSCGNNYEALGSHFNAKPNHEPSLSNRQREILVGLLMGDGSVYSNIMIVRMANEDYLEHISRKSEWLFKGVKLWMTAEESLQAANSGGLEQEVKTAQDMYRLETVAHSEVGYMNDWYRGGKKRFPEDLELTPTIAKHWYCGDGGLMWGKGKPLVQFSSRNESKKVEMLESLFEDVGFDASFSKKSLRIPSGQSKEFLEWMGEAPPGFEYKWEVDSKEVYKEKKLEVVSEGMQRELTGWLS